MLAYQRVVDNYPIPSATSPYSLAAHSWWKPWAPPFPQVEQEIAKLILANAQVEKG